MADESGVSAVTISNIERGKTAPRQDTIDRIQAALEAAGIEFTNAEVSTAEQNGATAPA